MSDDSSVASSVSLAPLVIISRCLNFLHQCFLANNFHGWQFPMLVDARRMSAVDGIKRDGPLHTRGTWYPHLVTTLTWLYNRAFTVGRNRFNDPEFGLEQARNLFYEHMELLFGLPVTDNDKFGHRDGLGSEYFVMADYNVHEKIIPRLSGAKNPDKEFLFQGHVSRSYWSVQYYLLVKAMLVNDHVENRVASYLACAGLIEIVGMFCGLSRGDLVTMNVDPNDFGVLAIDPTLIGV